MIALEPGSYRARRLGVRALDRIKYPMAVDALDYWESVPPVWNRRTDSPWSDGDEGDAWVEADSEDEADRASQLGGLRRPAATRSLPMADDEDLVRRLTKAFGVQPRHLGSVPHGPLGLLHAVGLAVSGDPGARRAQLGRVLSMRGVEDPCPECQGMGVRSYGSTATWRGGMGGQMITNDVCDRCWGSGDRYRSGCDLRKLRDEESARVAARAVDALASAAGAKFTSARRQVAEIATVLRDAAAAADKKRNGNPARDSIVFAPLARSLASMLDLAARSPAPPAPKE